MPESTNASNRSQWIYFLPALHLCACFTMFVGYFAPNWPYLPRVWTYLMVLDFPISVVAVFVAWKYSSLAVAWLVVVGTFWWYVLSRGAELLLHKFRERGTGAQDLIPKGDVNASTRRQN
jgi:hypothetical protein